MNSIPLETTTHDSPFFTDIFSNAYAVPMINKPFAIPSNTLPFVPVPTSIALT